MFQTTDQLKNVCCHVLWNTIYRSYTLVLNGNVRSLNIAICIFGKSCLTKVVPLPVNNKNANNFPCSTMLTVHHHRPTPRSWWWCQSKLRRNRSSRSRSPQPVGFVWSVPECMEYVFNGFLFGAWATPLKNMKVSWDHEISNIWENIRWCLLATSSSFLHLSWSNPGQYLSHFTSTSHY